MVFDYLHDADGDLLIQDGDFVVGESTEQHLQLLTILKKGELRQYPKTGVGIEDFLLDDNPGDLYNEMQRQFEADGLVVRNIEILFDEEGKLQTKAEAYYP